mgnify:CR=1 FL=1
MPWFPRRAAAYAEYLSGGMGNLDAPEDKPILDVALRSGFGDARILG